MTAPKPAPSLASRLINGVLALGMVALGGAGLAWALSRMAEGVPVGDGEPPHAQVAFLCGLLTAGGLWSLRTAVVPPGPLSAQARQRAATGLVSALVYGSLLLPAADPSVQAVWAKVFGPSTMGLPPTVTALLLTTLAYLPLPVVFWHLMALAFARMDRGEGVSKATLVLSALAPGRDAQAQRSGRIVLAGGAYVILVLGALIAVLEASGV